MSDPKSDGGSAMHDLCGLDADGIFSDAELDVWATNALSAVGVTNFTLDGLLDQLPSGPGAESHMSVHTETGSGSVDTLDSHAFPSGTLGRGSTSLTESAAPISTWAPGPGLNGSRGGGFAPAHAAPEQKLDGAHAAYHAVFDRIHPTCNAADAVPLGQRQHSQDSVQQAPDRMAPVGSGGSLSGVNSDTSNPWDSMSPQAHGPTDSTASPPPRASQAKDSAGRVRHRAAQRRYRQRQRAKMTETDQRFATLEKQLQEMRVKEATLLERNTELERSLAARAAAAAVKVEVLDPPAWGNRYKLNDATWDLIKGSLGSMDDTVTFTVREDRPLSLTREQICNFTIQEYKNLWTDYVNGFAVCMLHARGDVNSPAYQRLLVLLAENRALKSTFCIMRPDLLSAYAQELAATQGMPTPGFWKGIADSIDFSEEQLHKVRLIRNQALLNMGALMASRRQILQRLSRATDPTGRLAAMDTVDAMSTKPLAVQLDALLREENSFVAEMSTNAVALLSPLQHAHLVTMSFPYGPNVLAVFNILAARLPDTPAVVDVLAAGASAGPSSIRPLHLALLDLQQAQGLPQPLGANQHDAHPASSMPPATQTITQNA
eukprot:CAMPEP_0206138138 /NCGR_PEP_ID=MMETSP1473-20131121/3103_1 /ASSEMBLY_ACC=CAM_ASM_001109 /TAXON_ID=1461547 /ORGANISM="Stichococcus sp, Strain RCC1054" /LENGTH=603 /DNA_ID=CAMNT_0053531477 /DNA_START=134 /DNA_END=1945 /DNA_ORIENTATION=-